MSFKELMRNKDLKGLWISIAVHCGLLVLFSVGLEFSSPEVHKPHINVVQAVAIDNRTENRKRLEEQRLEQQKRERLKREKAEKEKKERLKREAEKKRKAEEKRKKEEQKKAEQKRKAEEARKQKELEAKRKVEQQKIAEAKKRAEAEKKRKAAEAKRKAEAEAARKQAEAEEFKRQQEEELKQLEAERLQEKLRAEKAAKEAEARARQLDIDRALYLREIQKLMTQFWTKPLSTKDSFGCDVLITQSRNGYILDYDVIACVGDEAYRRSVEQAVRQHDKLPLPRNPLVFDRKIRIGFNATKR